MSRMWFIFLGERLEIESSVGNDCEYDIGTTITHWCKYGRFVVHSQLRPCYTVQFFLQLAMQFYS